MRNVALEFNWNIILFKQLKILFKLTFISFQVTPNSTDTRQTMCLHDFNVEQKKLHLKWDRQMSEHWFKQLYKRTKKVSSLTSILSASIVFPKMILCW